MWLWTAIAGAVVFLFVLALYFAPARTIILVDTGASTARAEMRLLWGIGPLVSARALPRSEMGNPLKRFNDTLRIGHALMTPGIADAVYDAVRRLFLLSPKVARVEIKLNLGDPARNLVVQTATQAALAAAPVRVRDSVAITKCEAPGAEFAAKFELNAAPAQLASIYGQLRESRAVREFRRRLKKTPKPSKKPPREVQAS